MFSWYKYLIINLVFSHFGLLERECLSNNCTANQRICFSCIECTLYLISKSGTLNLLPASMAASDLVRNPDSLFSHVMAHFMSSLLICSHAVIKFHYLCLNRFGIVYFINNSSAEIQSHPFLSIRTCLCKVYPLIPHFYIAKLGYVGLYLFVLFLLQNIDCGYSFEPPRQFMF